VELVNLYEELIRKKVELATRAGRLRPDGLTEFVQFAEKAYLLRNTDVAEAEKLLKKATEMLPQVEKALEQAILIRDRIKATMIDHADKAVETYRDALKDLAK
jgi:prolyl oligopeptidase PreP (S9A serine peptidase family)